MELFVPGDGCIDYNFKFSKREKYSGWFVVEAAYPAKANPFTC